MSMIRARLRGWLLQGTGDGLEHDPEKWEPVFGKDHAPSINLERDVDSKKRHLALAWNPLDRCDASTHVYVREALAVLAQVTGVKALINITSDGLLNLVRVRKSS